MVPKGQFALNSKNPKERTLKLILGKAVVVVTNPNYGKTKSMFITQDPDTVDWVDDKSVKMKKKVRISAE